MVEAAFVRLLSAPTSQGSIVRFSWKPSIQLFLNPASASQRAQGALYSSLDEGKTWTVVSRLTGPTESFQYSSLCPVSDREVAVLYETRELTTKGVESYRIRIATVRVR